MAGIATYPWTITRGTDAPMTVQWLDDTGNPLPTAGYTAVLTLFQSQGGATLLTLTSANGELAVWNSNGVVTALVPGVVTAPLSAVGSGYYTLVVTAPNGNVVTLLDGPLTLV